MERFWKQALAACGIGAVGAFVFLSLYRDWLNLPVFAELSPGQTLFALVMFLVFTLAFGIAALLAYVHVHSGKDTPAPVEGAGTFPEAEWKTGADLMREFRIGSHQLLQHIEADLPAYSPKTDIYCKDAKPLVIEDVWFESDATDQKFLSEELPTWLFRSSDVKQYITESTQPESRHVHK